MHKVSVLHERYIQQHNEVYSKTHANNNICEGKYTTASKSSATFQPQMNKIFKFTMQSFMHNILRCDDFQPVTTNFDYLLPYLLIPRSRVLLEKLTGFQLVRKFPAIYGTWKFITAFTSSCHISLH